MPTDKDYVDFREAIVSSLKKELFGPATSAAATESHEELRASPLQIYGCGVLFPQKLPCDRLEDAEEPAQDAGSGIEDDDLDADRIEDATLTPSIDMPPAQTKIDPEGPKEDAPLNLANEFSPSALGITFRTVGCDSLTVDVAFGTYKREKRTEPHPRAGTTRADGSTFPDTRDYHVYRRTPHHMHLEVAVGGERELSQEFAIEESDGGLILHAQRRPSVGGETTTSLMLINRNLCTTEFIDQDDVYFQAEFTVKASDGAAAFTNIDRPTGSSTEDELASLALLYRHRQAFALGHGCAGDWERTGEVERSGMTSVVRTAAVPTYEVQPIAPRAKPYGAEVFDLSMRALSDAGDGTASVQNQRILNTLAVLCDDYAKWIEDLRIEMSRLPNSVRQAAERHLSACETCLGRMREGVQELSTAQNGLAMKAFRLANRAMLMQQVHSGLPKRKLGSDFPELNHRYTETGPNERRWRPFQLAFVLMNIAGTTTPEHPDRQIVDLIWFPTGGGKTEAYLGLAAYVICLRRLIDPTNGGTTALMRYTLRLLTAQQFERASALILALDVIRQDAWLDSNLGDEPISIGLWVGKSLSPNKRAEAVTELNQLLRPTKWKPRNPFQVLNCPWCKVAMNDPDDYGYEKVTHPTTSSKTVRFRCPDARCRWSDDATYLPIVVIDDDIYEQPPTLLLGTVDKFAQLAWESRTGRLFGRTLPYDPPELIIQDELHLISGPLGSMVALYEIAIERLCVSETSTPKIVASTATIRQASQQCRDLYDRETFEFPPQGFRAGDSYFAFEDSEAPGRLYAGVFASALKSHATAQVRACAALLQAAMPDHGEAAIAPTVNTTQNDSSLAAADSPAEPTLERGTYYPAADPYGTMVWYFNTLRELGHAATMYTGDIPEHIKGLCRRENIPYTFRRTLWPCIELTSRRDADEIPEILKLLERPWLPKVPAGKYDYPVDVVLATNMISVGVDVSRLGLMVVSGQPKSTAEYIQATSRVGRRHPGLVVTIYNQSKSRDRSHYETFTAYHQSAYRFVEATSITPFSPPARERGLRGLIVALARLVGGADTPTAITERRAQIENELERIVQRAEHIDPGEAMDLRLEIDKAMDEWERTSPPVYGRMAGKVETATLCYPYGSEPHAVFQRESWPVLTSMRNVDGTAEARVLVSYPETPNTEETGGNQ
jgi:hypothetical protein